VTTTPAEGGKVFLAAFLVQGRARFRRDWPLWIITASFGALGLLYSWATPIFEPLDELRHYALVKRLADGEGLPVQVPGVDSPWRQEGNQPPLYYALAAAATFWVDASDYGSHWLLRSEDLNIGLPSGPGDKFWFYHTRIEDFPYQRTTLAVHLARWLSLLMGAGTVVVTYRLAQKLLPETPAAAPLAAALVAFNPEFVFVSAQVSNDALINLLGMIMAYLLAALWLERFSPRRSWLIAALAGLIALAKLNGLPVLAAAGLVAAARAGRDRAWRPLLALGAACVLGVLLLSGWWYARNLILYHDLFALDVMNSYVSSRSLTLWDALREYEGFHFSYWGVFGLVNIALPYDLYRFYGALVLLAAAGLGLWVGRRRLSGWLRLTPAWLLSGGLLLAAFYWSAKSSGPIGRLSFPAIGASALLGAAGLLALAPARVRGWLASTLAVGLAIIALAVPVTVIRPVYATAVRRPPLAKDARPPLTPFEARLGDVAVLRGYEATRVGDDGLRLTLYWEAQRRTDDNLIVFTHLFSADGQFLAGHDGPPQGGQYPTPVWSPGELIADPHVWEVPGGPPAGVYVMKVGMYDALQYKRLPAFDAFGARYTDDLVVLPTLTLAAP
jgi:hypothetical protein